MNKQERATTRDESIPPGILEGIRVLDLSRILAGPACTQLLGDYGADVIKVERPGGGDDTRSWGPPYVVGDEGLPTGESAYYLSANRNKRSVTIDISTPEGAETVRKMARHCDVLIENFKVGGLKKYGLDAESLLPNQPELIYCSISGFGQTGPNAHLPGYDLIAQGYGGIMSLTGEPEGEPMKVAVAVADIVCGLYAATAILAALHHRDRTGEGQYIDIGLVDTQIAWLMNEGSNYLVSGERPVRRGNQHPNIVPYQVFKASDGHLIIAVGNDHQFQQFCHIIDRPALAADPRYASNSARLDHREELIGLLESAIATFSRDELLSAMERHGVPGGPINTLAEVFESSQVKAREMKISLPHSRSSSGSVDLIGNPVKFSKTPIGYRYGPPCCGEHTEEVLKELLGDEQINPDKPVTD